MSEFSKLQWRCRRGMKELDILLSCYLRQHYNETSIDEQQNFQKLLELPDVDLYAYFIGREEPTDTRLTILIEKIRRCL